MRSTSAALAGLLLLGACATTPAKPPAPTAVTTAGKVKIGKPYEVLGVWYTPARTMTQCR